MNNSRAAQLVERLRPLGKEGALRAIKTMWRSLPIEERAALAADDSFWAPRCPTCGRPLPEQGK